jgi:hypothetical protein
VPPRGLMVATAVDEQIEVHVFRHGPAHPVRRVHREGPLAVEAIAATFDCIVTCSVWIANTGFLYAKARKESMQPCGVHDAPDAAARSSFAEQKPG